MACIPSEDLNQILELDRGGNAYVKCGTTSVSTWLGVNLKKKYSVLRTKSKRARLGWFWHVEWKEEKKKCTRMNVTGVVGRGAPRKTWRGCVERGMRAMGIKEENIMGVRPVLVQMPDIPCVFWGTDVKRIWWWIMMMMNDDDVTLWHFKSIQYLWFLLTSMNDMVSVE